jgi:hypothetical protein
MNSRGDRGRRLRRRVDFDSLVGRRSGAARRGVGRRVGRRRCKHSRARDRTDRTDRRRRRRRGPGMRLCSGPFAPGEPHHGRFERLRRLSCGQLVACKRARGRANRTDKGRRRRRSRGRRLCLGSFVPRHRLPSRRRRNGWVRSRRGELVEKSTEGRVSLCLGWPLVERLHTVAQPFSVL